MQIIILSIFSAISLHLNAQRSIPNACTQQYDDFAKYCVESIMFSPKYSSIREEATLEGMDAGTISIATLSHVSQNSICNQIRNLLVDELNLPYKAVNSKFTRYFYQTDEFYYVFWGAEPGRVLITPITMQKVIIKKDFSQHWVFKE